MYIYELDLCMERLFSHPTFNSFVNMSPWVENITAALCFLEISSPNFLIATLAVHLEQMC